MTESCSITGLNAATKLTLSTNADPNADTVKMNGTSVAGVFPAIFEITKSENHVKIHLSISHEKEYACAIVILEN